MGDEAEGGARPPNIALAQEQFVGVLRTGTTQVKKWDDRILILVGIWLVVIGIWADFFTQFFPV